jgi:hypothetical protein
MTTKPMLAEFPAPWTIDQDESVNPSMFGGGFTVYSSNGLTVFYGGSFSGDGDAEFNLNRLQVEELVKLVNSSVT